MTNDLDTIITTTFTTETPSLKGLGNEPIPAEILRDLLSSEWHDTEECPRPEIHVLNDVEHPGQANLRLKDWLIVSMGSMEENQRGFTYEYKDINIPVVFTIHTVVSRQRLYNVMAEARRIVYKNNRTLRPYQLMYWDSFDDDSEGQHRYWRGDCNIRLTSAGVPVFKGSVRGMGSENLPPNQR